MARTGAPAEDRRTDSILLEMALSKLQYVSSELVKLRAAVADLQGISADQAIKDVPNSVFIDADTVGPFERGFYPREYDEHRRPFRWTGDSEFVELRFFVNRNSGKRFSLTGYLGANSTTIGTVRAFVDYSAVPLDISYDGNQVVLSGEIPPAVLENRATLTFWSPDRSDVAPGSDGRALWFVFSELTVTPPQEAEVSDARAATAAAETALLASAAVAAGDDGEAGMPAREDMPPGAPPDELGTVTVAAAVDAGGTAIDEMTGEKVTAMPLAAASVIDFMEHAGVEQGLPTSVDGGAAVPLDAELPDSESARTVSQPQRPRAAVSPDPEVSTAPARSAKRAPARRAANAERR